MSEFNARQLGEDELFLSGRLQFETALEVLRLTGINPEAEEMLEAVCHLHDLTTTHEAKNDLQSYWSGGNTSEIKSDLTESALIAERNQEATPELRIAASGLLELLGFKK